MKNKPFVWSKVVRDTLVRETMRRLTLRFVDPGMSMFAHPACPVGVLILSGSPAEVALLMSTAYQNLSRMRAELHGTHSPESATEVLPVREDPVIPPN